MLGVGAPGDSNFGFNFWLLHAYDPLRPITVKNICPIFFSSPSHIQEAVTRCPNHEHNDASPYKAHIIRAEHSDAQYGLGKLSGSQWLYI